MSSDLCGRTEAMEGAGGRLFLDLARSEGAAGALYDRPWTDDAQLLRLWSTPLVRLSALARELGARLLVVVPPDAHTVHAADLPADRPLARPTVGERFASLLGGHAEVLHLEAAMTGAKGAADPYRPTDSHWSAAGAYVAYRHVVGRLAGAGVRVVQPEAFTLAWSEPAGDLGGVCEPPRRAPACRAVIREPRARSRMERSNHRRHAWKVTEVDDPSLPTAVVFRDSFVTEMAPFLVEGFRRTVLVGAEARGFPDLLRDERPDVIIFERAERALPYGLADWDLVGWREHWPGPGDGPREADAARAERAAARALDDGRPKEALARANEAQALGPTPDRLFLLGRAALAAGRIEAADATLALACAALPARWSCALHLGVVRLAQGRNAEARDLFGRACALAPWHPRVFEHFGYASLALDDPAAARPALEHAVRIGPELAAPWLWLLQALDRLGDAEAAARIRREARAAPVDIPGLDG